jgi:hypothetical protein
MKNMLWSYTMMVRTTGREYDRLLNKGTFDTCNVQKGILGNLMVVYLKENMTPDVSNYKFQCPQPPGEIWSYNFPAFTLTNLPRFFMVGAREEVEFIATLRAKFAGVKGTAYVLSLKIYAVILF